MCCSTPAPPPNDIGWDPLPYRFDPDDGSGWTPWQASPTFPYTYIPSPLIDTNYTPRVEVKDSSGQVTQANGPVVNVTVPGGCFVSGVTGPAALNIGETKNFTVVAVGLIPGGYQWVESDPSIQFIGATNGPTVTIQAVAPSAAASTTFHFDGNGGICSMDFNITVYGLEIDGPGFTEMYVNRPDFPALGTDADQFGTILPVTGPDRAGQVGDPDHVQLLRSRRAAVHHGQRYQRRPRDRHARGRSGRR